MRIAGVILAGGHSSRMGGGDKALQVFAGAPMLDWILAAISPPLDDVLINSNSDAGFFQRYGLPVLADCLPGRLGPLAGLLTGMRWAAGRHATHIVSVPCDTPFLSADLVPRLASALAKSGAEIAMACDGKHPHPTLGLWPVTLADRLANDLALGVRAIKAWVEPFTVTEVPFDAGLLTNINTPADLAAANDLMGRSRNIFQETI